MDAELISKDLSREIMIVADLVLVAAKVVSAFTAKIESDTLARMLVKKSDWRLRWKNP